MFNREIDMTDFAEAIDNSYGMNNVMSIGNLKQCESKEENKYSGLLDELIRMGRLGRIKQAALITRDGVLIKGIPDSSCTGIFAAMMAAALGAAETAFAEFRKGKPDMMVLCMNGERIVVMGAGSKLLLAAIIEDNVNDIIALPAIENAAEIIKSMA